MFTMPELPEVETTVRGIAPYLEGRVISEVLVRDARLRWPVPANLAQLTVGKTVLSVRRRAKYILVELDHGHVLLHLGMSGSLRLTPSGQPPGRHDHIEFEIAGERRLRLRDPRRFGCVLWIDHVPEHFHLLANLGPEPLTDEFDGEYLYRVARNRKIAVKNFIMNSHVVVGVGNIYASEALFSAGIRPTRAAGRVALSRYSSLVDAIRETLQAAIDAGGTTLRDFVDGAGNPGYFKHDLRVYEREGQPCVRCQTPIKRKVIGQRSTYYCQNCQR